MTNGYDEDKTPDQPEKDYPENQQTNAHKPESKSKVFRVIWAIFTFISVFANIILLILIIGLFAFAFSAKGSFYQENVIIQGPRENKIASIKIQGIINDQQFKSVYKQLKTARKDPRVKGLIVTVNSPGGTVAASDRIYKNILQYRQETGEPVICHMQGLAASGGYYSAVSCEQILAEPTTITGSIGVIMSYFVVQELLEDKMGITPVTVKSGKLKGWPSAFEPPSPAQNEYLKERLIQPSYERFLQVVKAGRPKLDIEKIKELSDGSIYSARQAVQNGLIDGVGYFVDAVAYVKERAGIENAMVVEYQRPFHLGDFLTGAENSMNILNRDKLHEMYTPELMYLWNGY